MAASMIVPDTAVYVRFGSRDASQKPEKSLRIAGAKAAPSDYALVSRSWRQGTIVNSVCFAQGAAIYPVAGRDDQHRAVWEIQRAFPSGRR
jgi:hypothetical protein